MERNTVIERAMAAAAGSVEQLAAEVGVSRATMHAWASGRRKPGERNLQALAEVIERRAAELRQVAQELRAGGVARRDRPTHAEQMRELAREARLRAQELAARTIQTRLRAAQAQRESELVNASSGHSVRRATEAQRARRPEAHAEVPSGSPADLVEAR